MQTAETRDNRMNGFVMSLLTNKDCGKDRYVVTRNDLARYPESEVVVQSIFEELKQPSDDNSGRHEQGILAGVKLQFAAELRSSGVSIVDANVAEHDGTGNWIREDSVDSMAELLFCAAVSKLRSEAADPQQGVHEKTSSISRNTRKKVAKTTAKRKK